VNMPLKRLPLLDVDSAALSSSNAIDSSHLVDEATAFKSKVKPSQKLQESAGSLPIKVPGPLDGWGSGFPNGLGNR